MTRRIRQTVPAAGCALLAVLGVAACGTPAPARNLNPLVGKWTGTCGSRGAAIQFVDDGGFRLHWTTPGTPDINSGFSFQDRWMTIGSGADGSTYTGSYALTDQQLTFALRLKNPDPATLRVLPRGLSCKLTNN